MRTLKYKIQSHKRNRHLMSDTRIISHMHNHFVALSRRHYKIYGHCEGYKRAGYYRLCKHLTLYARSSVSARFIMGGVPSACYLLL